MKGKTKIVALPVTRTVSPLFISPTCSKLIEAVSPLTSKGNASGINRGSLITCLEEMAYKKYKTKNKKMVSENRKSPCDKNLHS